MLIVCVEERSLGCRFLEGKEQLMVSHKALVSSVSLGALVSGLLEGATVLGEME